MVWFSYVDGWNQQSYVEAVSFCVKRHMKCPGGCFQLVMEKAGFGFLVTSHCHWLLVIDGFYSVFQCFP